MSRIKRRGQGVFATTTGALACLLLAGCATDAAADATGEATVGEQTAVTQGTLTESLSWTGTLAFSNPSSLLYLGGQSQAAPSSGMGGGLSVTSRMGLRSVMADATASPSASASPDACDSSASPEPTSTATATATASASADPCDPTASPTPTATAEPSPTPTPGGLTPGAGMLTNAIGGVQTVYITAAASTTSGDSALVTWLPAAGSTVSNGGVLYRVDNEPVVLVEGTATLYRELTVGDTGSDVAALEAALVALGYGGSITVDETFTSATSDALEAFQEAMGIEATGELDPNVFVMHDGPVVVSTVVAAVGDEVSSGTEMVVLADNARDVTLSIDPAQLTSIELGAVLTVSLPMGGSAQATVTSIASAPSEDGTYTLVARLDEATEITGDQWTVSITYSHPIVEQALLVDPYALILLEGGRTAVRVLRDGEVVAVEVTVIATSGRTTAVTSEELLVGDIMVS